MVVSPIAPYLPQLLEALGLGPNDGVSSDPNAASLQDPGSGTSLLPGTVQYGSRSTPFYSQVSDGSIPPRLVSTADAFLYQTSFGTYSFNRSTPFTFSLRSRLGTPLTLGSMFIVVSASPLTIGSRNVTMATDNRFEVRYAIMSEAASVGIMSLSVDFFAKLRPKITVDFAKTPGWTLGDFNIVWSTLPVQKWLRTDGSSALDLQSSTTLTAPSSLTVDVGPTSNPSRWREWMTTDWSDAGGGSFEVGQVFMEGLSAKGFTVTFPANREKIDPTQVGSSSNFYGATGYPTQRKTFYYGSYYFLFWHDGTSIVYSSSSDGISWSLPHFVASDVISFWSFDVATRGPRVAVLWYGQNQFGDNTGLWLKKGTVFGSSIAWDSGMFGVAAVPSGSAVFPASLAMGEDGQFWAAGVWHDGSSNYRVWVYNSTDGEYFAQNLHYAVSCPSDPEVAYEETVQLTPLFRGGMMLFSTGFCDTTMHWRTWNPISASWSPAQNLTLGLSPGMTKFNLVSATTSVDGFVHLLYSPGGEQVSWAYYNNATSQWTLGGLVYSGGSVFPTISSDSLGNLYAFWFQGGVSMGTSYPMYSWKPKGSGLSQGWSTPIQPFGQGPPGLAAWGLSGTRLASKHLFAAWTACSGCTTYDIIFGSIPLPAGVASAPPSQAWNRLGLPSSVGDGEYVPPGNGLLTISQTDISVPGRNGFSLSVGRMYIQPYTFLQGTPFNFETSPYTNLGNGWQLNLPWVGSEYIHLLNGQQIPIVWTNMTITGQTTSWSFENHEGEDFVFSKTNSSGTIAFSLAMSDGTRYEFNGTGRLSQILDRTGQNKIQFTYNPATGLLSSVIDTVNRNAVFNYDGSNRLTSVAYGGQTVSYGYSGNSLTTVTDQLSNTISFQYSPTNNWLIAGITYPTGGNSTYTYGSATIGTDAVNYYVTLQNLYNPGSLVRSSNFTYEISDGTVTYTTIAQSNGTSVQGYRDYQFNPRAKSSTTAIFDANRVQMKKTTEWFDVKGRLGQEDVYNGNTNPRSYYTTTAYDSWGNIIYSKDPAGHKTYSSYANTDTQYSFQDYGSLDETTNGRVFYDDFNLPDLNASAWAEGGNALGREASTSFSLLSLQGYSPTQGTWRASMARTLSSFNFPLYIEVQMSVPPNSGPGAVKATLLLSPQLAGGDPSLLNNFLSVSLNTVGVHNVTKRIAGVNTQLYSWGNPGAVTAQWKIILTNSNTLTVFLDQGLGFKKVYASSNMDLAITPAYVYLILHNQNTVSYSAKFDYVGLSTSNTITVNGLELGQKVEIVDSNGVVQETKPQYGGPLTLNGTSTVFPYASLIVYAKDGQTVQLTSPTRDVWGGNVYTDTPPFRSG